MKRIGLLIQNYLDKEKISQKKLSEKCNLSDSEISRIISGKRENPNWISLCKIACALNFNPLKFLLVAGYITEKDIHPNSKIYGLETLNDEEVEIIQALINFFNKKKTKENIKKETK